MYIKVARKIGLMGLCLLINACSHVALVPVSFNVAANSNINADEHEISLPVRVKVYQLSNLSQFREATFRELWKMDKQVLKDSLLSVKELTISPGEKSKLKFERQDLAIYIGVVALFRHPELGKWRAYEKTHNQASPLVTSMSIDISGNSVRLK